MKQEDKIVLYTTGSGNVIVSVRFEDENFWMTQKAIAELFETTAANINMHIKNILDDEELDADSTIKDFLIVQKEGSRKVSRKVQFYSLDMIIAVGYRVNSKKATRFRQWATKGSMSTMQLRMVEEAKIHCAREHFRAISTDSVVYDVVDSYAALLDKVMG